jgi:hypothetical protein
VHTHTHTYMCLCVYMCVFRKPHYTLWSLILTLRQTTLGRTPLYEWRASRRAVYPITHNTHKRQIFMHRRDSNRISGKPAAADPHLRPGGHRDRHVRYTNLKFPMFDTECLIGYQRKTGVSSAWSDYSCCRQWVYVVCFKTLPSVLPGRKPLLLLSLPHECSALSSERLNKLCGWNDRLFAETS